jgi:hypothetical protein
MIAAARLQPSTPSFAAEACHRRLAEFNQVRLKPTVAGPAWRDDLARELAMRHVEGDFVECERALIAEQAAEAPRDADDFVAWFQALRVDGPGQNDPLFGWLARDANRDDMRWFLNQEIAGEAGFDDLVALTQVKMPVRAKLELARNFWDELGRGRREAMHASMLESVAYEFDLPGDDEVVWEAMALSNLMVALCANRRFVYHAIGALGAIELTAPDRVALVDQGLRRLDVPAVARRYYEVHATLDRKHSESWNAEVIYPLVREGEHISNAIAEGALMRLHAGARCFERYRRELGLNRAEFPAPATEPHHVA